MTTNNPQDSTTGVYQVLDTATWTRGRHLLKFGFDVRKTEQNAFRTLLLSQWVGQAERFLDMRSWDACDGPVKEGLRGYGGMDLSATTDLSAFVMAFPVDDRVIVRAKFWVPAVAARAEPSPMPQPGPSTSDAS